MFYDICSKFSYLSNNIPWGVDDFSCTVSPTTGCDTSLYNEQNSKDWSEVSKYKWTDL